MEAQQQQHKRRSTRHQTRCPTFPFPALSEQTHNRTCVVSPKTRRMIGTGMRMSMELKLQTLVPHNPAGPDTVCKYNRLLLSYLIVYLFTPSLAIPHHYVEQHQF